MPKYEKADDFVRELAADVLCRFENYKPVLDAKVAIDYLFAYGEKDEAGIITTPAITHNGRAALGLCRIINYRDRVKGLGDVEIQLDADWWTSHDRPEQEALLDHELYHIIVQMEAPNVPKRDYAGRPKCRIRDHDVEIGWFRNVAIRHGRNSMERMQAKQIMEISGQYFWPGVCGEVAEVEARIKT